jgi:hypothetical protein
MASVSSSGAPSWGFNQLLITILGAAKITLLLQFSAHDQRQQKKAPAEAGAKI